ncbi:MAG TPA: CheR family methyltransferase [Pelobium sp.]|nr:CheR family methyltransferase [Pelobium sp.]
MTEKELEDVIALLNNVHDFDFAGYSKASLKRRFEGLMHKFFLSVFDLKAKIINEPNFLNHLVNDITVNVTEMFRDADFFKSVKNNVIPYINSYQRIKVWNAGVATGEELYSFSILFKDSKIYDKSFFYGTDINTKVLKEAKAGIYDLNKMKAFAQNYSEVKLTKPFSDYFTVQYDHAIVIAELRKNCLFSVHNLDSDGVFNEFQLVICRNVLIYFNLELQNKVLKLLMDSLCIFGFLCLGSKEVIRNEELQKRLKIIDKKQNIYQRIS